MNDSIALLGSQNATYSQATWYHRIGKRNYELTNHLGNVLSVISDKPLPIKDTNQMYQNDFSSTVSPFLASSGTVVTLDASNRMKVDCGVHYSNSHMTLTTTVGKSYRVYFDIDLNSGGNVAAYVRDMTTNVNIGIKVAISNGSYYYDFVATNTSLFLAFENSFNGARLFYVDNIKIEEYEVNGYLADIRQATDYSAFGVQLSGRTLTASGVTKQYRQGFNGMEQDDEIKGDGNSYDFEARMLDPRLGRWLTIDQHFRNQPDQSPYKAFNNSPIIFSDPDGKDEYLTIIVNNQQTGEKTTLKVNTAISTKIMTDGLDPNFNANNYYDFETIITVTIDKKGKTSVSLSYKIYTTKSLRDFDMHWGSDNVESKFHTKLKSDGFAWGAIILAEGKGERQNGGMSVTTEKGRGLIQQKTYQNLKLVKLIWS